MCGLKMMGEPVVSVFSSRSSEIPGASEPGAKQMVKEKTGCFIQIGGEAEDLRGFGAMNMSRQSYERFQEHKLHRVC